MLPILSVAERRALDETADVPVGVLIERAGFCVARQALRMLGGGYGRRVVVVAGPGNNGNDGRAAASHLRAWGATVEVVAPGDAVSPCDLVIDACFGSGLSRPFDAGERPDALVLAVDVPSGIDGDSGERRGAPWRADATVALVAPCPGLLQGEGSYYAGELVVADIGLVADHPTVHVIDDADLVARLEPRTPRGHKWRRSVGVLAGGPGMEGAGSLVVLGALRAGASMVRLFTQRGARGPWPIEAVRIRLDKDGWHDAIAPTLARCMVLAIGPGVGTSPRVARNLRQVIAGCERPMVLDADALSAISPLSEHEGMLPLSPRVVLTPHAREFERLFGENPEPDPIAATRAGAAKCGAVVLAKGAPTVIAHPDGRVHLSIRGTPALSTAGSGDVLTGVIAALIARGVESFDAAGLGAHLHARSAMSPWGESLLSSDLPDLVGRYLADLSYAGERDG